MEFDRIRVKAKKSGAGSKWEVVKETHKAGNWNGTPDKVDVIDRGLTRDEAIKLAERNR
jgi:hypothetical protein